MAPTDSHGWWGRILEVDLAKGQCRAITPDPDLYARFLGGRGLAARLLEPWVTRSWDDPQMPLILMTGPLVGTVAPTSGRLTVYSRSPQTGTVGGASVGGALGTQLKRAGWDGVIIRGQARELSGLVIQDAECRILAAAEYAGQEPGKAIAMVAGRGSAAAIGPAAENGVRFAGIMVDRHHAAGRGGLGLVMAAKNLKYLAARGTGRVSAADLAGLKASREEIMRLVASSPVLTGEHGLANYGTSALYDLISARRMMPTANFRLTHYLPAAGLNAAALKSGYAPHRAGCKGCHILCKQVGADGHAMPEYETLSHFTALVNNTDLATAVKANELCNRLGMDTISTGAVLACWAEISGREIGPELLLRMISDIGLGRGEGAELARGATAYAKAQGRPQAAMAVKDLELPAYDPRGAYGMALAYATSPRGGCHLAAYPISHEILRKPVVTDRFSFAGKARIIKIAEDVMAVVDSLTACKFVFFAAGLEEYAQALSAVTGTTVSAQDLMDIGERIVYQERIMNARNGFDASADDLPARFFAEAGSGGDGFEVTALDREDFLAARAAYYRVRGLTPEGMPTAEKASELGLEWKDGR